MPQLLDFARLERPSVVGSCWQTQTTGITLNISQSSRMGRLTGYPSVLIAKDLTEEFEHLPMAPRGDVRIVFLIKVERQRQRILVEQWYRGQQSPSDTVVIMPNPDKPLALYDASHWVAESAPMIIPFGDVFLRLPTRPRETNLVLTEQFFINMGKQCWQGHTKVGDA